MRTGSKERLLWMQMVRKFYGNSSDNADFHFEELLGCREFSTWMKFPMKYEIDMDSEVYHKLKMLEGPYGDVYYKILVARKENA